MRIIGPPSATRGAVTTNLRLTPATATFTDQITPALWGWATTYGIDPVGVVAQSYKETGAGRFGGAISAAWYNTCGLKVRHTALVPGVTDGDQPLAHAMFPSWDVGALAHVQHLCAYTGVAPLEVEPRIPIVDPRYGYVLGSRLENWSDLGGRWAPSPTYGVEIETLMRRLRGEPTP